MVSSGSGGAALLGAYELGRTVGEGNFGKVKQARHRVTGAHFAVKILDRARVLSQRFDDQIRREIATLKLLRHPNVVRLHEVAASRTKIYMVLEFVNGGELFDRINDGLLHTTCGSPNYIAPEVLQNRGYDGSLSDIWSCGVILYIMLVGYLPFDDRNIVVLYQKIFKGDTQIPKCLSPGAQNLLKRILEPNPMKRITMAEIKEHEWFKKDYVPVVPFDNDDEDSQLDVVLPVKEEINQSPGDKTTHQINAFQLIGMASSLDLSGFFEEEDVSQRKIRFTTTYQPKDLFDKIERSASEMGFQVQRGHGKLKVTQNCTGTKNPKNPASFLVCAEVFELGPSLYVVELKKSHGDPALYRQLCERICSDLGVLKMEQIFGTQPVDDLASLNNRSATPLVAL
ncbi:CBL-interacting protein kinase 1 [Dichanthelium oligosanthes]|uniref:non-specific serine/threonine protein kinase n=1 Tax=Dichanthelium oligosanthes TaxID=888268 RepID=A0A1E5WLN0_9POAL|nr:CBL-interacting protein kinase 1 [Dichanthelium oligosanthes]